MNCDEVRDLAGAYVLGSVSENERRQIEDHLAGCDLHAEIAGLAATTMGLAAAAPEMDPPSGLGERISVAVRAEHDAADQGATAVTPVARSVWSRSVSSRTRFVPWSVAAALAVAVGALIIWNVTLQLDEPGRDLVHFFKESDGDWVQVDVTLGESTARVSLGGFEPLPSGRDYQLWAIRDDAAISLGVFDPTEDGKWSGDIDFELELGDRIAVTEEAEGGSSAPTTDPLLSTRL